MDKFLSWVAAIAIICGLSLGVHALPAQSNPSQLEVVTISENNSITFRGEVTEASVANVEMKLRDLSSRIKNSETIYLVMDTPGGDVDAGLHFIDFVHGLPQKVKTVTVFAASMGFHIVQNLDERLITPSGVLMSHRASLGGASGEVPGKLITRINAMLKSLTDMDRVVADRMKMNLPDYQNMIRDEYWVTGKNAKQENAADRQVLMNCDRTMNGTVREELANFMGIKIYGTFAKCPAITGLLKVEFELPQTDERYRDVKAFAETLKSSNSQFVEDYIVTGKYAR